MNETIVFNKIYKSFQTKGGSLVALKNVSFSVHEASICGVIGQSGAGKSTLLRLVNGLDTPSEGEVRVLGKVVNRLTPKDLRGLRKRIGMIFQHFNLLNAKTVFDNVALPLRLVGRDAGSMKKKG